MNYIIKNMECFQFMNKINIKFSILFLNENVNNRICMRNVQSSPLFATTTFFLVSPVSVP